MPPEPIAGRYELLEELGHGGMGDVWRGYDAVLDRPGGREADPAKRRCTSPQLAEEFAKRFRREARITARIQHPGVPQVYDAVLDASLRAAVPGHGARRRRLAARPTSTRTSRCRSAGRPRSPRRSAPCCRTRTTCRSSTATSSRTTSCVARDGTVKVLDFGIAAILRTDVTKLTATGSPDRHPPVHGAGAGPRRTDHPADRPVRAGLRAARTPQWAAAVRRRQRVRADAPARQRRPHAACGSCAPDVPAALEELVLHLLRKAPEARPADTQEVYERLLPFLPLPGEAPAPMAGPAGVPDPTGVFRHPYAPRRPRTGTCPRPAEPRAPQPMPVPLAARGHQGARYAH